MIKALKLIIPFIIVGALVGTVLAQCEQVDKLKAEAKVIEEKAAAVKVIEPVGPPAPAPVKEVKAKK